MTENTQPPKLKWKDKEYEQSSLTDQQKYLFAQLIDIEKKENNARTSKIKCLERTSFYRKIR